MMTQKDESMQEQKQKTSSEKETKYLSRLVARRYLPHLPPESPLLPPDRWIWSTLRDLYKTVVPFRRDVHQAAVVAGAGLFAGGYFVATVAAAVGGALSLGGAFLVAGVAIGGLAALMGREISTRFQAETLPLLRVGVAQHYILFKMKSPQATSAPAVKPEIAAPATVAAETVAAKRPGLRDRLQELDRSGRLSGLFDKGVKAVKDARTRAPKKPPHP